MKPCPFAVGIAEHLARGIALDGDALNAYKLIIAAACQTTLDHAAGRIMDRSCLDGAEMCLDSHDISDHVLGVIAMDIVRMKKKS